MSRTRKRPWLAVLLSMLYPGAGQLYLRRWRRAILWFGLFLLTTIYLIPPGAAPETFSIDALIEANRQLSLAAKATVLVISAASMIDAYLLTARHNKRVADPDSLGGDADDTSVSCPECGHDLDDPEIGFCPWCAEEFDPEEATGSRTPW